MKFFHLIGICMTMAFSQAHAQQLIKGRIIDSQTKEILPGASIIAAGTYEGTTTDLNGRFQFIAPSETDSITIIFLGYQTQKLKIREELTIQLEPSSIQLDQVIVSANRDQQERKDAPVAISSITPQIINETKATSIEQLINKVHGVYMVDLGNEQHSMSIRQPLSYGSLFLYMEDGIPIRTTGMFNHNALIEMNMASVRNMEIIKGPASSLYGSEAIGGAVNFITHRPSSIPSAKIQIQGNNLGYKRSDFLISNTWKNTGIAFSGYIAKRSNGPRDHTDFDKTAVTTRIDHRFSNSFILTNVLSYINYETDMTGGLDSATFYNQNFSSQHTFTNRTVAAIRYRTTADKYWTNNSKTSLSAILRDNVIGQNPNYRIKDDYKPWNNSGNKLLAHGEINESSFKSYGMIAQHKQVFNFLNLNWISGISADISPAEYNAKYIKIDKDVNGIYKGYTETDSLLADYSVKLNNSALYTQIDFSPIQKLKVVGAFRYDRIDYNYDNHLSPNAFSGAPDEKNYFDHLTPKAGITLDVVKGTGVYANYSVGFSPPDITELYRGVKVPSLKPATYKNYEAGTWIGFAGGKGLIEISIYQLDGLNEIVNVKQPDGSYENQNAGQTQHKGIEYSINYSPMNNLNIRFSAANAHHTYIHFEPKGDIYTGNSMLNAPHFISNSEITFKPTFVKGIRVSLEWQHMGNYYLDEANTEKYPGFNVFNLRFGYEYRNFDFWFNTLNITDELYATIATKSAWGKSYRAGESRSFNLGVAYNFTGKERVK